MYVEKLFIQAPLFPSSSASSTPPCYKLRKHIASKIPTYPRQELLMVLWWMCVYKHKPLHMYAKETFVCVSNKNILKDWSNI